MNPIAKGSVGSPAGCVRMYEGVVQDLIDELGRLPGVGPKSAQRIAFYLLAADPEDVRRLADVLHEVKERFVSAGSAATSPKTSSAGSVVTLAATSASSALSRSPRTSSRSSAPASSAAATTSWAVRSARSKASVLTTCASRS